MKKPKAVYRDRMNRYPDAQWLIWSNKRSCWYRPNCQGYTDDIARAGVFDREVAARHYLGNVPRSHRDVEPFPVSAVARELRKRASQLRDEADVAERLAVRLDMLVQAS